VSAALAENASALYQGMTPVVLIETENALGLKPLRNPDQHTRNHLCNENQKSSKRGN
jgi:hypothetical protein